MRGPRIFRASWRSATSTRVPILITSVARFGFRLPARQVAAIHRLSFGGETLQVAPVQAMRPGPALEPAIQWSYPTSWRPEGDLNKHRTKTNTVSKYACVCLLLFTEVNFNNSMSDTEWGYSNMGRSFERTHHPTSLLGHIIPVTRPSSLDTSIAVK